MLGTLLNQKYRLVRQLGQGGMGAVYAAEDLATGQTVAVKLIDSRLLEANADSVRRFRRESRAAGAIKSEHIVRVLDSGADEDRQHPYIVMELLEGEDLQQILDRVGPLQPDTALRIGVQALRGLHAAHQAGIIHRDIKPSNLFLTRLPDGSRIVKLLDFGIAKVQSDATKAAQSAGMTGTGDLLGSPLYMSPEQVMSTRDVDARSDLWSLGSVLYCAIAGYAPHIESSTAVGRLLVTICSKPIPPLRERAPWVPPAIEQAIAPALERTPAARYPTANAMLEALLRHLPEGTALHDDLLVAADTGPHVVLRPALIDPAASEVKPHDHTLPASDPLAFAPTAVARSGAQSRTTPPSSRQKLLIALPAVALLLAIPLALLLQTKSPTPASPATNPSVTVRAAPTTSAAITPPPEVSAAPENIPATMTSASASTNSTPRAPSPTTKAPPKKESPARPVPTSDSLFERNAKE